MSEVITENIPTEKLAEILKKSRNLKGYSIDELALKTNITRTYIIAFENSEYEKLPKLLYVKGFLKILAKELDLNAEFLISKLIDELGVEVPVSQNIQYDEYFIEEHVETKRHVPSFVKNRITFIILIIVIVYVCIVIAKIFFGGINLGNSQHVSVFHAPSNQVVSGSDSSGSASTSVVNSGASVTKLQTQHTVSISSVSGSSVSGDSNENGRIVQTVSIPKTSQTVEVTTGELQQKMSKMQKEQASQAAQDSGASID